MKLLNNKWNQMNKLHLVFNYKSIKSICISQNNLVIFISVNRILNHEVNAMEYLSEKGYREFRMKLAHLMQEVCQDNGLFPNSLQYIKSTSKKMDGYKLQIFEEEYPAPKDLPHEERKGVYDSFGIALIKEVKEDDDPHAGMLLVYIKSFLKNMFGVPEGIESTISPSNYFGFYVSPDSDDFMKYLKDLMNYRIKTYRSNSNTFACCSSFTKCSDAKQCVHYNLLYSTGCTYRMQHLEKGEIFYGKNKNI